MSSLSIVTLAAGVAVAFPGVALATDGQSNTPDVIAALKAIQADADKVAAGQAVADSARDIAVQWGKVGPKVTTDGDVLVEAKMANANIISFEKDYQAKKDLKSDAKDVSSSISDLVGAEKPKS